MKKSYRLLIYCTSLLIGCLCLTEKALAETILQRQGVLEQGDQVLSSDGSLYDRYTFEGQAGQQVTIILESREFDTYLILLSPDGSEVGRNDDTNQTNSVLTVTLPAAGAYTVIANSYERGNLGRYMLTVSSDTASTTSSSTMALQDLPDGDYRFYNGPPLEAYNPPSRDRAYTQSVILRKRGDTVVGIHFEHLDSDPCFRGLAFQNTVGSITSGYEESVRGVPTGAWIFSPSNGSIDLDIFRSRSSSLNGRESILEHCVEGMSTDR